MQGSSNDAELRQRSLSALVLAPVVLLAVYLGSPFLEVFLTIAAILMAWEWDRLCGEQRFGLSGLTMILSLAVAGFAAWMRRFDILSIALVLGSIAAYVAAAAARRTHPAWISMGPIIIGVPCAALIWLRGMPIHGFETALWLVGAIWATDLAAFSVGRLLGGPRLAPRISPKKTWSGLIGAVVITAAWGVLFGYWVGSDSPWLLFLLGACAAVVAQLGDLSVSFVKRRFGAKDASNLIPGHGGVLDRLDGMLTSAPALVVLVLLTNGGIF